MFEAIGNFFLNLGKPKLPAGTWSVRAANPSAYTDMSQVWGGSGSDGSKWPGGLSRSGAAPNLNHRLLRLNARKAYHDSLQARAIVERHTDTVIDVGLKLNATPSAKTLGITAEAAEEWASNVNEGFDHWARNKRASVREDMNFYQLQRLAGTCQQRDGEYFCRFMYSARKDLLNPLQLQFLDTGQIMGDAITTTHGLGLTDIFRDGIDRDANGKEVGYNVGLRQTDGQFKFVKIPAVGPRSKRTMMVHGYMSEYPGQGRGYSRLSHALQEFENITDFSAAEVKKAIIQSCFAFYTKPSKENVASNPFDDYTGAGPAGPAVASEQAQAVAQDNNVNPKDAVTYTPLPEATFVVPGSAGLFNLNEGETLESIKSTAPGQSFPEFINTLASHLSASVSMPFELVLMKFGENFSASRAALVLFWRVAQIWRDEMASDLLNVVYENWLAGEIAAGRIMAPGWSDPRLREAWLKNNWVGSPMPNIDPLKSAKADQIHAELGATDLDRVAQELNGSSGKANRAKLDRQYEELPKPPWKTTDSDDAEDDDEKEGNK